jgi:hypothetical protein
MANSIPCSRGRLQRSESGAAGLGQRCPRPPFAEPHHVDRRCRQEVLKLCRLGGRSCATPTVGNLYCLCRLRWGGNENPVVARPWEVTYDCHNSLLRLDQRGSCPAGPMLSRARSIPGKDLTPREPRKKDPHDIATIGKTLRRENEWQMPCGSGGSERNTSTTYSAAGKTR